MEKNKILEAIIEEVYFAEESLVEEIDEIKFRFAYWNNWLEEMESTEFGYGSKLIEPLTTLIKSGVDGMATRLVNLSKEAKVKLFERGVGPNFGFKNYLKIADQAISKYHTLDKEYDIRLNSYLLESHYGDNAYATALYEKIFSDPLAQEHNITETDLGKKVEEMIWNYIDKYPFSKTV